jgi:hypothetical protein
MFIKNLTVRKHESYESPANQLVGSVVLEGPTGKQEIVLSSMAISRLFRVIAEEVVDSSRSNAKMTKNAVEEAIHAPLLESSAKIVDDEIPF